MATASAGPAVLDPNRVGPLESGSRAAMAASTALGIASGSLRLQFCTAQETAAVSRVLTVTGGTAAAATPTLCRVGVYQVDPLTGDLTLGAAAANDTTLWSAINAEYSTALTAPLSLVIGRRYAIGMLIVTAVATPTFRGAAALLGALAGRAPILAGAIGGQTDLPASIPAASIGGVSQFYYSAALV